MRTVLLLAAALLAGACAPKSFTMQGKDPDQMIKDEAQCRDQVRAQAQNQRNIEDQRRSVFDGERERFGQQELYTTMDNQGYKNNVDRLTARCMAPGGGPPTPKNSVVSWFTRNSPFNTPRGKYLFRPARVPPLMSEPEARGPEDAARRGRRTRR